MNNYYPWQHEQWTQLHQRHQSNGLPHALLFAGPDGIGKFDFARALSASLLCEQPNKEAQACGSCKSCQLLNSDTHPDYSEVLPEEEGKAIKVDQIRELIEYLTLHAHYSGPRIVILSPAEQMNVAASNSLLKTLEEPRPGTLLILVSSQPAKLSATIRSRCQLLRFTAPDDKTALNWLAPQLEQADMAAPLLHLANGGPLLALSMAQNDALNLQQQMQQDLAEIISGQSDPVSVASQWVKHPPSSYLNGLYLWVSDMIKQRSGAIDEPDNAIAKGSLQSVAKTIDLKRLYAFMDKLIEAIRYQNSSANDRLTIEGLLILWANMQPKQ
ncbi:MAG: DNA polymerase III subunit delta' [Gammaproteobacteria bacterium]|nr:DNA polymerase III subunit delta' [Gammaproteobacteria bacterium]